MVRTVRYQLVWFVVVRLLVSSSIPVDSSVSNLQRYSSVSPELEAKTGQGLKGHPPQLKDLLFYTPRANSYDSTSSLTHLSGTKGVSSPTSKSKRRTSKPSKISSDFSRRERIVQLLNAAERVVENNGQLQLISR